MIKFFTVLLASALILLQTEIKAQEEEWEGCSDHIEEWLDENVAVPDVELEVACTSLNDEDCDCLPEGTVNWDGANCGNRGRRQCPPANYFGSVDYQELSHEDKMSQLWNQMTGEITIAGEVLQSPTKVKCQNFDDMWKHFVQAPGLSMTIVSDEMPNRRQKLVHQQGLVGQARFVIDPSSLDQNYTGIFESGAEDVIVRFSEVGLHVDDITSSVNPSVALKFLRSEVESANQFGMVAFEGDPDPNQPWNWFAKNLTSHLPQFSETSENMCIEDNGDIVMDKSEVNAGECGPMTAGRWMGQAAVNIAQNGNVRLAEYDEDGVPADQPKFPWQLIFKANGNLTATDNSDRFYNQLIQGGRAEIEPGTLLYEVFELRTPIPGAPVFKIGEIIAKSYFTQSLWADERLFFMHTTINHDFNALPPEWRRQNRAAAHVPSFDFDKYGSWNNPADFTFTNEQGNALFGQDDVISGMSQSGCPFAFAIDYINQLTENFENENE